MDRKYFESIRAGMEQMQRNEAKASGAGDVDAMHYCATHVEHTEHGKGVCISEEHAEPAADGSIEWYTVQFEGKEPMVVNTSEMKVLQAENHMHSKKKKVAEAAEGTVPKTEKHKQLAALAEPKDKITHADVLKGRGVTKEETESDAISEIIEKFDDFEIEVKESYTFGEFLVAAKALVVEEDVVAVANMAFNSQDIDFMMEAVSREDIMSKIASHEKAGNKVSTPSFSTKNGEPHAEYTVTDKEGVKRRYIHHGNVRKVENLGS